MWSGPEAGPRGKAKKPLRSRKGVEREREREREREKKREGPFRKLPGPSTTKSSRPLGIPNLRG